MLFKKVKVFKIYVHCFRFCFRFVKPGGVDSLCIQCKKDSPIAQCAEWLKEQKTNEGGGLEGANISNSSSGDADGSRGDLDETGVELPEAGGMGKSKFNDIR